MQMGGEKGEWQRSAGVARCGVCVMCVQMESGKI